MRCILAALHVLPLLAWSADLFGRKENKVVQLRDAAVVARLAEREACLSSGEWVRGATDALPPYSSHMAAKGYITGDWYAGCDNAGRQWQDWWWEPSSTATQCVGVVPAVEAMGANPVAACAALGSAKVLVIGDSINHLFYQSLLQHVGWSGHPDPGDDGWTRDDWQLVCGGRARVQYFRNDLLLGRGDASWKTDPGACGDRCRDPRLYDVLEKGDFDVLVLNRGAHWVPDTELVRGMEEFLVRLKGVLKKRGPAQKPRVFWRTTVPGHGGCDQLTRPLRPGEPLPPGNPAFHWGDFEKQNALVAELLHIHLGSALTWTIDAYAMTKLRQDRHMGNGDCLHYCLPGPPDWWVEMFLWFLQEAGAAGATGAVGAAAAAAADAATHSQN